MKFEDIRKQVCERHKDKPIDKQIAMINLSKHSQYPALVCHHCLDADGAQSKQIYISINKYLDIQKGFKEINDIDVEKQLDELNYVQKRINDIFEQAKKQVIIKSNDNKFLSQKYKIESSQKNLKLNQKVQEQIKQFNNQYIDIYNLWKKNNQKDQIDTFIRNKYFSQNNSAIELQKISQSIANCFTVRLDSHKRIDEELDSWKQSRIFYIGNLPKNEMKYIQDYIYQYETSKVQNSRYQLTKLACQQEENYFQKSFLKRYLVQACIYGSILIFVNPNNYSKELKLFSDQIIQDKNEFRQWKRLSKVQIANNMTDQNLINIFSILKCQNIKDLKIYLFINKNQNKYYQQQLSYKQLKQQKKIQHIQQDISEIQNHSQQKGKKKKSKKNKHKQQMKEVMIQDGPVQFKKPKYQLAKFRTLNENITFKCFQNKNFADLKILQISHISLKLESLKLVLQSCSAKLQSLKLQKNNLQVECYPYLKQKIKAMNNSMRFLQIKKNNMTQKQCTDLFADKDQWNKIMTLDFSCNQLDDKALNIIFQSKFTSLKKLYLISNKIKKPDALINAQLNSLQQLDLSDNDIQTASSKSLVCKKFNNDKVRIDLSKNRIDQQFLRKTIEKIKYNQVMLDCQKSFQQNFQKYFETTQQKKAEGDNKSIQFKVSNNAVAKQFIKDIKQTFNKMDVFFQQNPKITSQICQSLLSQQPTNQQVKESLDIEKQLRKKAQQQQDSLSIILLGLKDTFCTDEDNKQRLIFNKNSNIKTQLSTKIISTQFMQDLVKFQQKIQQGEGNEWKYDQIQKNDQKLVQFKQWYIEKIAKQYGIDKETISIHRIIKGSIKVQWSTTAPNNVIQANITTKKLKIHRYFEHFRLSPDDFCTTGNTEFGNDGKIQYRGGWPYFMPVKCKRYGLNVSGKYDNGNDRWLEMKGQDGQWVVAFHGVSCPTNPCGNGLTVMSSIVSGLNDGTMLRAGGGQAYQNTKSLNKPNEDVGRGIYCSPHIQVTFGYSGAIAIGGKNYHLIFQCRVNPKKIKVCSNHQYWVINDSKDIRPYGVLLVKAEDRNNYPSASTLYGADKIFKWDYYKDKIKMPAGA